MVFLVALLVVRMGNTQGDKHPIGNATHDTQTLGDSASALLRGAPSRGLRSARFHLVSNHCVSATLFDFVASVEIRPDRGKKGQVLVVKKTKQKQQQI